MTAPLTPATPTVLRAWDAWATVRSGGELWYVGAESYAGMYSAELGDPAVPVLAEELAPDASARGWRVGGATHFGWRDAGRAPHELPEMIQVRVDGSTAPPEAFLAMCFDSFEHAVDAGLGRVVALRVTRRAVVGHNLTE